MGVGRAEASPSPSPSADPFLLLSRSPSRSKLVLKLSKETKYFRYLSIYYLKNLAKQVELPNEKLLLYEKKYYLFQELLQTPTST